MKRPETWLAKSVILLLAITGCTANSSYTPQTTKPSLLAVETPPATIILTLKPANTLTVPSPTRFSISTITPSATPAMSAEEILNSFRTNGRCLLPCWWGILPGDTTIETVKRFTEQFGSLAIHVLREETGNFRVRVPDGNVRPEIDVVYGPLQADTVEWLRVSLGLDYKNDAGEYEIRDGHNGPRYLEYYPTYTIAAMLRTYGQPDTILLSGDMTNEPGPTWVYALTMVYPEKGIWVEYFGGMGGEPNFSICPMQTAISLWLWRPGEYASVEEVLSSSLPLGGWGPALGRMSTIEEKTDLTPDEFYKLFKDADYNTCFESPTERWYSWP